jgi:DNA primase
MSLIDCCSVALAVRDWFREWDLGSSAKVSGAKGIQVYAPLNTPSLYAEVGYGWNSPSAISKAGGSVKHRRRQP